MCSNKPFLFWWLKTLIDSMSMMPTLKRRTGWVKDVNFILFWRQTSFAENCEYKWGTFECLLAQSAEWRLFWRLDILNWTMLNVPFYLFSIFVRIKIKSVFLILIEYKNDLLNTDTLLIQQTLSIAPLSVLIKWVWLHVVSGWINQQTVQPSQCPSFD